MKYQIIYSDPPWSYKDKGHAGKRGVCYKYKEMSLEQICNIPVSKITDENCVLFLWCTKPHTTKLEIVMESWGFKFKTLGFEWIKINKNKPTLFWGGGNWTRSNPETCWIGIKGKPKRISASVHSVVFDYVRKPHSTKPPEVRRRIVQLMGDLMRIELFARIKAPGWDAVGHELDGMDINESLGRLIDEQ